MEGRREDGETERQRERERERERERKREICLLNLNGHLRRAVAQFYHYAAKNNIFDSFFSVTTQKL